jgi:hypothetical protein
VNQFVHCTEVVRLLESLFRGFTIILVNFYTVDIQLHICILKKTSIEWLVEWNGGMEWWNGMEAGHDLA